MFTLAVLIKKPIHLPRQ